MRSDRTGRTGTILFAGQVIAMGTGFAALLALARLLPPAELGLVMAVLAAVNVAAVLVNLNIDAGAARFLADRDAAQRARFLAFADRLVLAGALVALAVFLLVPNPAAPDLSLRGYFLALALVPLLAWLRSNARISAALDRPLRGSLPRLLARPVAMALAAGLILAGLGAAVEVILGALVLVHVVAGRVQRRRWPRVPHMGLPGRARNLWITTGLQLLPGLLLLEFFRDLVLLSAATGLPRDEIAHLSVALAVAALPAFGVTAAEIAWTGRIVQAVRAGNRPALARHLAACARQRMGFCLLGVGVVAASLPWLGWLLGGRYDPSMELAMLLLAVPMARAVFGNPFALLSVTGHPRAVMLIAAPMVLLTATLLAALSALAGLTGVATGTVLCCLAAYGVGWRVSIAITGADPSIFARSGTAAARLARARA